MTSRLSSNFCLTQRVKVQSGNLSIAEVPHPNDCRQKILPIAPSPLRRDRSPNHSTSYPRPGAPAASVLHNTRGLSESMRDGTIGLHMLLNSLASARASPLLAHLLQFYGVKGVLHIVYVCVCPRWTEGGGGTRPIFRGIVCATRGQSPRMRSPLPQIEPLLVLCPPCRQKPRTRARYADRVRGAPAIAPLVSQNHREVSG